MESLTLTFGAALGTGLVFGAGPCTISCLPFLGPVFVGRGDGAWRSLLPFSAGRLVGYSALGAAAGGAGHAVTRWLEHGPAAAVLGTATLLMGIALWRRAGRDTRCNAPAAHAAQPIRFYRRGHGWRLPLGLFGMGVGMALNPCLPLGTVLLAASASAAVRSGLWLGLGFGIGAVLVPTLVFGWVVAHFGAQLRLHLTQWRRGLERSAGGMLMMLGVVTATGWVQP